MRSGRWLLALLCLLSGLLAAKLVYAQGQLEVPTSGSFVSGLGYISGWKCTAGTLTFTVDNGGLGHLVYGGERLDTSSTCGDATNGFIVQYNWNLLPNGQHTIRVYDNSLLFGQATFTTTRPTPQEFLTGQSASTTANLAGKTVNLAWQENQQNFVIVGTSGVGGPPPGDFNGNWDVTTCITGTTFCLKDVFTWRIVQNGPNISITAISPNSFTGTCTAASFVAFDDLQVSGKTLSGSKTTDTTDLICGSYSVMDFMVTLDASGQTFSGTDDKYIAPECDTSVSFTETAQGVRSTQCPQ